MRARPVLVLVLALLPAACGDEQGFFSTLTTGTTSPPATSTSVSATTTAPETTTSTVPPVGEWAWSLAAADPATFGGTPMTQAIVAMTGGGPGLVAVGSDFGGTDSNAAVWISPDGLAWSRVPHDEAVFGGPGSQSMAAVVAGGPGVVAVGSDDAGGDRDAAVWTSPDGVVWSRVPHDEAVFGGAEDQKMTSVAAGGPGLVAVGVDAPGGDWNVAVWVSSDGVAWSRVPHDEAALGGPEGQSVRRVAAWSGGLVAVGQASAAGEYYAAVWTSADGIAWSRVPHDEAVFGGPGTQAAAWVVPFGAGLVAVGIDGPAGGFDAAVWTSADGVTWSRVTDHGAVFGGDGSQMAAAVVAVGGGLVAVGQDELPPNVDLAVWVSSDGLTWSRVPHDEAVFGRPIDLRGVSAVAGGPGVVVVDGGGAVWVAAPPG